MLLPGLAVFAPSAAAADSSVQALSAAKFDSQVLSTLSYTHGDVSKWLECDGGNGIMTGGTNKSYLQVAVGTSYTAFKNYCKALINAGYTSTVSSGYGITGSSTSSIAYGRYLAADGSHTVYVYITNAMNEVRVVVDTQADMVGAYANGFAYESTTGETAQPMLCQYGLSKPFNGYSNDGSSPYTTAMEAGGAFVVIRMPDNSIFIHDGGDIDQWSDDYAADFMKFCRQLTGKSEGEKVVINTWFISHAHNDHFCGFPRFIELYHDQIEIQNVMYNIDDERLGTSRSMADIMRMVRVFFPKVKYYKPHTGERFDIAGVKFDVLWAQEDRFYPASDNTLVIDTKDEGGTYRDRLYEDASTLTSHFNDTSTVLRVTFPDAITGAGRDYDCILYADANLAIEVMHGDSSNKGMYTEAELATDILMIPHHGYNSHPDLVKISKSPIILYTQSKSGIFGPNGIADLDVDMDGTYHVKRVNFYLSMSPYFADGSKVYWDGTETTCILFGEGKTFERMPNGPFETVQDVFTKDTEAPAGFTIYTMDAPRFPYTDWVTLSTITGANYETSTQTVETETNAIRGLGVEVDGDGTKNDILAAGEKYIIVHDKTNQILTYDTPVGTSSPALGLSLHVGTEEQVAAGEEQAYFVNGKDDRLTFSHHLRDAALWELSFTNLSGSNLVYKGYSPVFGGNSEEFYYRSFFFKNENSKAEPYWKLTSADMDTAWRLLQPNYENVFNKPTSSSLSYNIRIEFFKNDGTTDVDGDGVVDTCDTCVIYYSSGTKYRFLTVNDDGVWVRKMYSSKAEAKADLDNLKLRLYKYEKTSNYKKLGYEGPTEYTMLKGTSITKMATYISNYFTVKDQNRNGIKVPCSATTAQIGYYWIDYKNTVNTANAALDKNTTGTYSVPLYYRNDNGTDTLICTLTVNVVDKVVYHASYNDDDTLFSGTEMGSKYGFVFQGDSTGTVYETDADGNVMDMLVTDYAIVGGAKSMTDRLVGVTADMLTDASGNKLSTETPGVYTNLTLTYEGIVVGTGYTVRVVEGTMGHRYSGTVTTEPTCTAPGLAAYVCDLCGHSYTEEIAIISHSYIWDTCSVCGHVDETYVEPTYCLFGYINGADYGCEADYENMGTYWFVDGKVSVAFTQDSYVAVKTVGNGIWYMTDGWQGTEATAVTLYDTTTITACDKLYIPANTYVTFTLTENPDGSLTLRYEPTVCNHTDEETGRVEPTCTEEGQVSYHCTTCFVDHTETLPALGHKYMWDTCTVCGHVDETYVEPTYCLFGYINGAFYACEEDYLNMGTYWFEDEKLAVIFEQESYVAVKTLGNGVWYMTDGWQGNDVTSVTLYDTALIPTSANRLYIPAKTHVILSLEHNSDGTLTLSYVVAPNDHSYEAVITPATCETDGYTTYTCACGDSYVADYVAATGHSYEAIVTAPTCTEDGYTTYTCACGDSYVADEVAATGHHYKAVITVPTCTEGGYTTYTCFDCEHSYVGDEVPAVHNFVNGKCIACGAIDSNESEFDVIETPTIIGKSFTLSFEDEILVNFYYEVSDMTYVVEQGMMVFDTHPTLIDIGRADDIYIGSAYAESSGYYMNTTTGIAAKDMGDSRYYAAYVQLSDETYVYSAIYEYSPKKYAMNMLAKSTTSDKQKALCVAMLNYGAAAQSYFGYNTDALMNAELTAEHQALVTAYDASLFTGAVAASGNKTGNFAATDTGYSKKTATVSFEGAFAINYYFTPSATVSGEMKLYYWTPAGYAATTALTADNATGSITMVAGTDGRYWGQISGIAAKALDDTYYVAAVYTDAEGNSYCTGVIAYSLSKYCMNNASGTMGELAQATAMYGYYAKLFFTA